MSCNNPIKCWRSIKKNEVTGKFPVTFRAVEGWGDPMTLPCGKCAGCLRDRSTSWGIRCLHESQMHKENSFLTLTYHPDYYPKDNMLKKKHFQDFMKRLRKKIEVSVRYLHCGEYGAKSFRAHYHALLFGYDFPDKVFYKKGKNGDNIFLSQELHLLWKMGLCVIGNVTFASSQYVAKYINKSAALPNILEKNNDFIRPYNTSSRRPGLGIPWLIKNWKDVYPRDFVIVEGHHLRPPRAYDKWLELNQPEVFRIVKRKRLLTATRQSKLFDSHSLDLQGVAREALQGHSPSKRETI